MKLSDLEGKRLGGYRFHIQGIRRGRSRRETNFEIYLVDNDGNRTKTPVIIGLYNEGDGKWVRPWMEIDYRPTKRIEEEGLESGLFKILSGLLPPGGILMVRYLDHKLTKEGLAIGIPPAATPLGYLLWEAGFCWFKDWYFPEGWKEGEPKLQGTKPLNEKIKKLRVKETIREIKDFIGRTKDKRLTEVEAVSRDFALKIVKHKR